MADTTTISTQGHFGTVNDRLVAIMTQGHFDIFYQAGIPRIKALEPKHLFFGKDTRYKLESKEPKYKFATHGVGIQKITKNEKENVWAYAWDAHTSGNVTLTSVTFEVFDADDVSVQGSDDATIVDNGTPTPDIYGLVDTTDAAFVVGSSYYVRFTITIGSELRFHDEWFEVA